jgi:hypothetical protein
MDSGSFILNKVANESSGLDSSDNDSIKLEAEVIKLKLTNEQNEVKISSNLVNKSTKQANNKFSKIVIDLKNKTNYNQIETLDTTNNEDLIELESSNQNSSPTNEDDEVAYNQNVSRTDDAEEDEANSLSSIDSLNEVADSQTKDDLDSLKQIILNEDLISQANIIDNNNNNNNNNKMLIKRTHLKNLIFELYECDEIVDKKVVKSSGSNPNEAEILVEGVMEKLPPGKTLKNSILLAWKKRYFKLNSIGMLYIYEINDNADQQQPSYTLIENYNLMGAQATYEQNRVISLDDGRGNSLVFRCFINSNNNNSINNSNVDSNNSNILFQKWKSCIDSQIIDRSEILWVKPNRPLSAPGQSVNSMLSQKNSKVKFLFCFYSKIK